MPKEQMDKMRMELRRGVLVLAVLSALSTKAFEHYGYSLRKYLIEAGIDIDEGTLYPLIRRLEGYGLLASEWREGEGRKKRYYRTTKAGDRLVVELKETWSALNVSLNTLLGGLS